MKKYLKRSVFLVLLISSIVLVSACSGDGTENQGPDDNGVQEPNDNANDNNNDVPDPDIEPEEVTLKFYFPWDDEVGFMFEYGDWIEREFPHITIEYLTGSMEDLILAGEVPDIIRVNTSLPNFMNNLLFEYELEYDMTELIEQHNFDLSRVRPDIVDGMQAYSPNEEIYALGTSIASYGLFYNKDVFDRFGVSYPTDDMTWDDVHDLHIQLTREEDGVQYQGVEWDALEWIFTQRESNLIADDGSIDLPNHEGLRAYMDLFDRTFSVPGSVGEDQSVGTAANHWREGNVGMFIGQNISWHLTTDRGDEPTWEEDMGFDWGVVNYPSWSDKPNVAPILRAPTLAISNTSDYKDEAFEVISFFFSEEYQGHLLQEGRFVPGIVDVDIEQYQPEAFEIDPFIRMDFASPVYTEYLMPETRVRGSVFSSLNDYLDADMDVTEFLREQNDIAEEIMREEGIQ